MRPILPESELEKAQNIESGVTHFLSLKRFWGEKFSQTDIFIYLRARIKVEILFLHFNRDISRSSLLRDIESHKMTKELKQCLLRYIEWLRCSVREPLSSTEFVYGLNPDSFDLDPYLLLGLEEYLQTLG